MEIQSEVNFSVSEHISDFRGSDKECKHEDITENNSALKSVTAALINAAMKRLKIL